MNEERLIAALKAADERIAREHPETAVEMTGDEAEVGRRDYARALVAEYFEQHEPGANHEYEIECRVCGQRGMIRLSVDPPTAEAPA